MTMENVFAPQHWMSFWKKAADDQVQRMQTFGEEWAKVETKAHEQWSTAIDEMTKLNKESLAYGAQLAAEWRKQCFDAMKKNA
jgi:hypothetical protein